MPKEAPAPLLTSTAIKLILNNKLLKIEIL